MKWVLNFFLFAAIAWNIYQDWQKPSGSVLTSMFSSTESTKGFQELLQPNDLQANEVLIIAAENCPKPAAQRADELAELLQKQGVQVKRSSHIEFGFSSQPSNEVINDLKRVMNSEPPIVFINNRGKANPSLEEVLNEYKAVAE